MKNRLIVLALSLLLGFSVVGFQACGGTTLGLSLENDFTNDSILYGGYLRTGGLFKLELGGAKSAGEDSDKIDLFSYFLADLTLGSFGINNGSLHLYLGGSPVMTLDTGTPAFGFSTSSAYGKIGLQLKLFPFSIQVQSSSRLNFSGEIERVIAGVGFGLSF